GKPQPYIGTSDLVMIPSIVVVAGLNVISTKVFRQAVFASAGMLDFQDKALADSDDHKKPLIAASMFGLTTPCINHAKSYLEDRGYEVLIFHVTGIDDQRMERVHEEKVFAGVLEITTSDRADDQLGGVLKGRPNRIEEDDKANEPQMESVVALDMPKFVHYKSVPEKVSGRKFY